MKMFRIGQKVVCVKDNWKNAFPEETMPRRRQVLTVRTVSDDGFLRFVEIVNPVLHYGEGEFECEFDRKKFRRIVEKKTDISVFEEILRRAPVGSRLPANVT
jgi:hypothetical protein